MMRTQEFSKVSPKGQVTLPASIRRIFKIKTGQSVTFAVTKAGILVKPVEIEVTDVTEKSEWQKGLEEALEDVKEGRVSGVMSEAEFLEHLKSKGKNKRKSYR